MNPVDALREALGDGVEEVVISPEAVEGSARPLRIYSERAKEIESSA